MSTPSILGRVPASGSGGIHKPTQESVWNTRGLSLPGGDANIYKSESPKDILLFRSLKEGTGITFDEQANYITINGASTTTATSLGGDVDVYKEEVGGELRFRGLTAGTGITFDEQANYITINGTSPTTTTSLGDGAEVYKEEVGGELRFRSLTAGTGIRIDEDDDEITISSKLSVVPTGSIHNALVLWDGADANRINDSDVTYASKFMTFPSDGGIVVNNIVSNSAFTSINIEDVTILNGNLTGSTLRATTKLVLSETTPGSYQSGAGNLYTDTNGDLRMLSDKFNNDALNLTPWSSRGQIQYCNQDPVNDGASSNPTTTVLTLGTEGQVLTANATSKAPEWRNPNVHTTETISVNADDVTETAISLTVEHSFIDVTDSTGTLAKLTLADASTIGTVKSIYCRSITNPGVDTAEVKVNALIDSAGTTGTKSFTFKNAGESVMLIWNGTYWHIRDTGASIINPTF